MSDLRKISEWDDFYLGMARYVASKSKDPSTQTGAVIVRPDNTVASLGFNGFPKKMPDQELWYQNREEKYSRIIHCEMNAVLFAKENLNGYTLYTYPFISCDRCFVHMVQAGITRFVAPKCPADKAERWKNLFDKTHKYAGEMGVVIEEVDFE